MSGAIGKTISVTSWRRNAVIVDHDSEPWSEWQVRKYGVVAAYLTIPSNDPVEALIHAGHLFDDDDDYRAAWIPWPAA